jgi:hypothetical protein
MSINNTARSVAKNANNWNKNVKVIVDDIPKYPHR